MAATFNKFQPFVEALAKKKHNLGTDQLKVALCNAANPPLAADAVLTDQVEIAYTNLSSRLVTTTSCVQTAGLLKLILVDLVLAAAGGSVAPFRYVVLYNDTATNDDLIGWFDYGADQTLLDTETLTVDFDAAAGALTLQ